VELFDLAAHLR